MELFILTDFLKAKKSPCKHKEKLHRIDKVCNEVTGVLVYITLNMCKIWGPLQRIVVPHTVGTAFSLAPLSNLE